MEQHSIGVFLLDPQDMTRVGLRHFLSAEPGISVLGEATELSAALLGIEETSPEVAVVAFNLRGTSVSEVCREIKNRYPQIASLVLTTIATPEMLAETLEAGASGYVSKAASLETIANAVRAVAAGERVDDSTIPRQIPEQESFIDPFVKLTEQERRILGLLMEAASNQEIAGSLYLAPQTVKNYVSRILMKLGLRSRLQLVVLAQKYRQRRLPF